MANEMRLVTGDQMTEWITVESAARMMEEAVALIKNTLSADCTKGR